MCLYLSDSLIGPYLSSPEVTGVLYDSSQEIGVLLPLLYLYTRAEGF